MKKYRTITIYIPSYTKHPSRFPYDLYALRCQPKIQREIFMILKATKF